MTPVTLELGGKSPALIHSEYPLERAAERILAGKLYNAGYTRILNDRHYATLAALVDDAQSKGDQLSARSFPVAQARLCDSG